MPQRIKVLLTILFFLIALFFIYNFSNTKKFELIRNPSKESPNIQKKENILPCENCPNPGKLNINKIDEDADQQLNPNTIEAANNTINGSEVGTKQLNEEDAAIDCPECENRILDFLADPSNDEASKTFMTNTWIRPETKGGTLLLVKALKGASNFEQHELKDHLMQLMAGAETSESIKALIAVINGEVPDINFQEFPKDIQYAIQKAIRLSPNSQETAQILAEKFENQSSPEAAEAMIKVGHPMMVYLLAKEAYDKGDLAQAEQLSGTFTSMKDSSALEGIMLLGMGNIVSIDTANQLAYEWASSNSDAINHDHYETYLSEFEADPVQRSVAAYVLAGSSDTERALTALIKAYDNEQDTILQKHYENAMNLLKEQSEISGKMNEQLNEEASIPQNDKP